MSDFYSIDSTRMSLREYWWGARSPLVLLPELLKWLRVRVPSSTDDPSLASRQPFAVQTLPAKVAARFAPTAAELAGLGFLDPAYHLSHDADTGTTSYWATLSGEAPPLIGPAENSVGRSARPANEARSPRSRA